MVIGIRRNAIIDQLKIRACASWLLPLGAGLLLAAWQPVATANFFDVPIGPGGSELLLDIGDGDESGVRIQNLGPTGGQVTVELLPGAKDFNLSLPQGFLLLDNTLHVTSNLLPGGRRLRARMDFGRYGRAGIRALGIRVGSLRLLRADITGGRWIRATDSIRRFDFNQQRVLIERRFLRGLRVDPKIGNYGIDFQKEFAWAVVNTSGNQVFALAGLKAIPLPAAWILFLSGSGLLMWIGRRRRQGET